MAFCEKERQLIDGGCTCVDNKFFINYLPDAPDIRSAVYLLGLALSNSQGSDNSIEAMSQKLNITPEETIDAYRYWEELGLVSILEDNPPRILYLNVRGTASSLKKIKPSKYTKFSKDIQAAITGRMITVNEYNEYYTFLENTAFEPSALVAVAKYCAETKGDDINYRYILTVARNQMTKGVSTLAAVQDRLNSQQKYDADLKLVFKALGVTRKFDHNDRENYEKWTKDYGFTQDVIVYVAKKCKTGGADKLDKMLSEYYKRGVLSAKEIDGYESEKLKLYELTKAINKTIGVFYQSLDVIIDEYVMDWLRRGYDDETLLAVAKYCFRSGIRTLNGLASVIDKLYKNGVTTLPSLEQYLASVAEKDDVIKSILDKAGLERKVTSSDRTLFKTWTQVWSLPTDVILYVAEQSAGASSPMIYINKTLSDCKQRGELTVEQIKARKTAYGSAEAAAAKAKVLVGGREIERRTYTDSQIADLFSALDDTED